MSLYHQIVPFIVEHEYVKDLKPQEIVQMYYNLYWEDKWDDLGLPLAACMLDTAVTMGKKQAENFFKKSEGSYVAYLQLRLAKYKDLIHRDPSQKKFEKDWMGRVTDLRRFIDGKIQNPD